MLSFDSFSLVRLMHYEMKFNKEKSSYTYYTIKQFLKKGRCSDVDKKSLFIFKIFSSVL